MFQLRSYQKEAVDKTLAYFQKKKDPAVIVLPTGAGKSLVIAELAKIAKGRVLSLAHVKELVEQNHKKYLSHGLQAGIYSAGLNRKDTTGKVIFGSIQSVARASESFFKNFSILIIDECHRVSSDEDSQYHHVISKVKEFNPNVCILGLTATPYRLELGWIYNYNQLGEVKTKKERFFKHCIFELPLKYMIKHQYLTPPVKIDIPITCYDFSELRKNDGKYSNSDIENILNEQRRLTPLIIKNVIDISEHYNRQGVMIFSSTVKHAREIMTYLPQGNAELILGETEESERDRLIQEFKEKKFKYLVNVSVLTTGFDAPHVDVIALLRPTESVSLYQQIIGRGLRLSDNKKDCFVLDYTGIGHDIYGPEISEKRVTRDAEPVLVICPDCGFENHFWGKTNEDGVVTEHFGRKCKGAFLNEDDYEFTDCEYLFRYKCCDQCGEKNDITARECRKCQNALIDADAKLKQARLSKNMHVLKPDSVKMNESIDKNGNNYLEIKYFDFDAQYLRESYYLNNQTSVKKFNINFLRSHLKRPELSSQIESIDEVIKYSPLFRTPEYVIARKQGKFWRITEKIFAEEL